MTSLPQMVLALWIWLNPRLFPAPRSIGNWMSAGLLGERLRVTGEVKARETATG